MDRNNIDLIKFIKKAPKYRIGDEIFPINHMVFETDIEYMKNHLLKMEKQNESLKKERDYQRGLYRDD